MKTISLALPAVITILMMNTSCLTVKHDNGKHKGWYKNTNNPHNPANSGKTSKPGNSGKSGKK